MHILQVKQLRFTVGLSLLLWLGGLLGFFWLTLSHHRIRAAFMPVKTVAERDWFAQPPNIKITLFSEDEQVLSQFLAKTGAPVFHQPNHRERLTLLLDWYANFVTDHAKETSVRIPEDPAAIWDALVNQGRRGSCHNDAILFITLAQASGLPARIVDFAGTDGLGGHGHTVAEVWLADRYRWALVDAQHMAWIEDGNGRLLSALDMRRAVKLEQASRVEIPFHIIQRVETDLQISDIYLRVQDLYVLRKADFATDHAKSPTAALAAWLEGQSKNGSTAWLKAGRFVRSVLGRPYLRYRFEDAFSPDHKFDPYYLAGRFILTAWLFATLLSIGSILSWWTCRRQKRRSAIETEANSFASLRN